MRFYKYIIYRLYTWRLQQKDNTPVGTVVMVMCIVHFFQGFTIYSLFTRFVLQSFKQIQINKPVTYVIAFGIVLLYYFFVYNKRRWDGYIEEFKYESLNHRKRGTLLVRLFTIGSIVLFFVCMSLLFLNRNK